jgi:UDP-glucose 4-epimerase
MKILVTGGAGFIGSHTVDALIEVGHRVSIIDDLSTGMEENINPKATFYEADIRDKKVAPIFEKEKPEAVYHFAAQISLRRSFEEPVFNAERNILGSLNLLECARKYGTKKFIFASSGGGICGEVSLIPTPETHPPNPTSPYGLAKLTMEKYLEMWRKLHGLDYLALRYSNVYGPRQNTKAEAGVIALFIDRILQEEPPIINGDGEQTRDYVFVKDVVKANLAVLDSDAVGTFNIGTSTETTVNELLAKIQQSLGANIEAKRVPEIKGEVLRSALESKKAQEYLGWRSETPLEEGIEATIEYFRRKQRDR